MGKFKPGQSGNPAGKPPGTLSKAGRLREQFASDAPDVIRAVIDAAKNGDMQAARLVLERLTPPVKTRAEPVQFALDTSAPLTAQANQVMQAVSQGDIDPDTGKTLIDGLASLARVAELDEVRERLEKLEGLTDESE